MFEISEIFFTVFVTALLGILILPQPYLGVIFTAASLVMVELLPSIPFLSSIAPLIGLVTLIGFFFKNKKRSGNFSLQIHAINVWSFLFIFWMFVTHPQAAWNGADRNWVFTFVQLWLLTFLSGELLDTYQKHRAFLWIFSAVSAISALIAIQQGYVINDISLDIRAIGLTEGANSAARYFVVGMIFFSYLRINEKNKVLRLIANAGMIITFLGVFFTVSRTGMVLLFTAVGLMVLLNPQKKQSVLLIGSFFVAIIVLTFMSDSIFKIIGSIIPSISQGTDTIGLRYKLWGAAWRMWLDYPVQGVGIGMYPIQLRYYAGYDLLPRFWSAVTHNTYLQVLSETGIVGFGIFMVMLTTTLKNLLAKRREGDIKVAGIQTAWFIVFLIMLLGGVTMNQSADKIIWIVMGASLYFQKLRKGELQEDVFTEQTEFTPRTGSRTPNKVNRPALKNRRIR